MTDTYFNKKQTQQQASDCPTRHRRRKMRLRVYTGHNTTSSSAPLPLPLPIPVPPTQAVAPVVKVPKCGFCGSASVLIPASTCATCPNKFCNTCTTLMSNMNGFNLCVSEDGSDYKFSRCSNCFDMPSTHCTGCIVPTYPWNSVMCKLCHSVWGRDCTCSTNINHVFTTDDPKPGLTTFTCETCTITNLLSQPPTPIREMINNGPDTIQENDMVYFDINFTDQ